MNILISNWPSFQSYKDRKPPWIRLHRSVLDNYEFHAMSANARALLPMLWLLASEDEDPVSGAIRYGSEKIAFRLRLSIKEVENGTVECEGSGFLKRVITELNHSCNQTVTEALRNGRESVTSETETETETETERTSSSDFTPDAMRELWNRAIDYFAGQGEVRIPKVQKLTKDRIEKCKARTKSIPLDATKWKTVLNEIHQDEFLSGFKPSAKYPDWKATFDYVIKNDTTLLRIIEQAKSKEEPLES